MAQHHQRLADAGGHLLSGHVDHVLYNFNVFSGRTAFPVSETALKRMNHWTNWLPDKFTSDYYIYVPSDIEEEEEEEENGEELITEEEYIEERRAHPYNESYMLWFPYDTQRNGVEEYGPEASWRQQSRGALAEEHGRDSPWINELTSAGLSPS